MHIRIILLLSTIGLPLACQAADDLRLQLFKESVTQYDRIEFAIEGVAQYAHPFDAGEVDLSIVMQTPAGMDVRLPAFWIQPYDRQEVQRSGKQVVWRYPSSFPVWRARYAPQEVGEYSAVAELTDSQGTRRSKPVRFTCTSSDAKGFVRVSQSDPRYFEFSNGQPFFPIGQNLAFIGENQQVSPAEITSVFERLSKNGANYLRIWTCCHDWAMALEARKSGWGRSWNWKPPFALLPGDQDVSRKYVHLDSESRASVEFTPSHSVALRPGMKYRLTGRVCGVVTAQLQVSISGKQLAIPLNGRDDWTPFEMRFETAATEHWLGRTLLQLTGNGSAWIDGLSLKEAEGGPELFWEAAVNRPERGFYNPIDCAMLDDVVETARANRIYLQLCLITRDAYMHDFKNPDSAEYSQAIADAKNLLRYAVARWGYSTSVATWEYFNENDPGLPMKRFYRELGQYLDQVDVYRHLRSTSTWHPSTDDCANQDLDVADVHFYLREVEDREYADEVEAVIGNADWLRRQAPAKPALIGEFGLADLKWGQTQEMRQSREIIDFHNALWASALSGASGTAMCWWWDRLDPRNHYPHYRPLADFVADIPWTSANMQPVTVEVSRSDLQVVGLQAEDRAYCWLFDPAASFEKVVIHQSQPHSMLDVRLEIGKLVPGTYHVEWWDTRTGEIIERSDVSLAKSPLQLTVPPWQRDVACKVTKVP